VAALKSDTPCNAGVQEDFSGRGHSQHFEDKLKLSGIVAFFAPIVLIV